MYVLICINLIYKILSIVLFTFIMQSFALNASIFFQRFKVFTLSLHLLGYDICQIFGYLPVILVNNNNFLQSIYEILQF